MKTVKQIVCLMLICMVCFSMGASAEKSPQHLAAEELNRLCIMVGDETGDLMLGKAVTRAEMTAIICRISGLEEVAKNAQVATTAFSDVSGSHWAAGYIQLAYQNGMINGYPDGTFLPEQQVSYAETIKMLIAVLGYLPKAEAKEAYPHGVLMVANELDLTSDLVIPSEKPAIRSDVALLVYRSLDIPLLLQVGFGANLEYQVMENKTLRSSFFENK